MLKKKKLLALIIQWRSINVSKDIIIWETIEVYSCIVTSNIYFSLYKKTIMTLIMLPMCTLYLTSNVMWKTNNWDIVQVLFNKLL